MSFISGILFMGMFHAPMSLPRAELKIIQYEISETLDHSLGSRLVDEDADDVNKIETNSGRGKSSLFSFLTKSPPPGLLWVTIFLMATGVVVRIYAFVRDERHRKNQDNRSVNDEYWLRKVIFPLCLEPLVNFIESEIQVISAAGGDDGSSVEEYKAILKSFKIKKENIVSRFLILKIYDSSIYRAVSDKLDDFEDIIVKHCAYKSMGEDSKQDKRYCNLSVVTEECYGVLCDIILNIKEMHNKFFLKRS